MADRSHHDYQLLSTFNHMDVQLQSSRRICCQSGLGYFADLQQRDLYDYWLQNRHAVETLPYVIWQRGDRQWHHGADWHQADPA